MFTQIKSQLKYFINQRLKINVEKLTDGRGQEQGRYSYQIEYFDFNIGDKDKVIDIGSGGHPFPLATHLADLYEGETTHRTEKLIKDDRPFILCPIEKTPFLDKEFDFVYCAHVLEHLDDPGKACEELMRIGKRGYIETPTKTSDIMFNFTGIPNHHKWHTQLLGDVLVFMEWTDSERHDVGTSYFFEQFHSQWANPFQELVYKNRHLFYSMMLWDSKFKYLILDKKGSVIRSNC